MLKTRRSIRLDLVSGCAVLACLALPSHGALVNRWSFNNTAGAAASGVTMTDSVSGAVATVRGNGSTFTGTGLTITGATTGTQTAAAISGYVDLPNGIISSKTNLSVEIWASPLSYKANARMFDFGRTVTGSGGGAAGEVIDSGTAPAASNASDAVYVNFCLGSLDTQRMKALLNGTTMVQNDTALLTTAATMYHYVFTFEDGVGTYGAAGGRMTWYRNGATVTTADVNFRLQSIEDVNNWLGRSNFTGDSLSNANYNEVRLYNHVLSSAEINADLVAGPDSVVTPTTVTPPVADNVWTFTTQAQASTPSGTAFTDSVGGKIATLRGSGGSLTGGAVVLPGTTTGNQTASAISAYLDLPNGIVTQTNSVSFEAWATPLSSKNWQRLFDFGRCVTTFGSGAATGEIIDSTTAPGTTAAYDNLSLTFNNAANISSQQLEGQYDGNAMQYTFTSAITNTGTQYHYVMVVEDGVGTYGASGCQVRWYRNGALQNTMSFQFRLNGMEDVNNWIGRSMYTGDSNSNLSLNELRIYRRAITQPEIQASFTAGPDPTVGPPEPPAPQPVPSRRWSFNTAVGNAASGTTFADAATGEIATVRGNNATLNGTSLVLPSTATTGNQTAAAISGYLDLANGIVSSRPSLTFEAWITPLSSKNWQRIFDFGSSTVTSGTGAATGEIIDGTTAPGGSAASDNIFLSLNNGTTLGSYRLEGKIDAGTALALNTDLSASTTINTEYHYVMSVQDGAGVYGSSGCQVKWYRNSVLQGTVDLNYRLPDIQDVNNWIGRSQYTGDSNSNIALNELRLYDRALTAGEIVTSYGNGPNTTFGPPVVVNDAATIHPDQKVVVDVLTNDGGDPLASTLQILSPPSTGTAVIKDGKILYTHSGASNAPVTFTYRVGNSGGLTSDGTVTISFAASLRLTNTALAMPSTPPANTWQLVDALPGLTFTRPICLASIPSDTKQLYVCEQNGAIKRVADVTATTPVSNTFFDLSTLGNGFTVGPLLAGQPENGLLGLAFHPNYATNGYFYVAYTIVVNSIYYQRVSRFTRSSANPTIADPTSERILLNITDFGLNHNGGDLHFGPNDGYLYYGTGDGENSTAGQAKSQRINDNFYSGIFRMDVDKKPGSLTPNSHASVYLVGGVAGFNVPPDNPFVHTSLGGTWNGIYNGADYSSSLSSIRTEFWCTGIRHCWRFSFDATTGDLWEGDVGQVSYEEINKIVKGGNYGWAYREGKHAFSGNLPAMPAGFTSIEPIYEYPHPGVVAGANALYTGNSVVGGYVYRGTRYSELVGKYIFSDSVTGHVWQMDTATGAVTRLTGLAGAYGVFSAQGEDPSNKDLLFCAYLNGKIMRLSTGSGVANGFPTTLTATHLFADLSDLSPSPGLLPYEPNLTFWSDYAVKRRWFTIPDATSKMTWSKDGNWTYPTGTVWVKHFDLELSRDNPATKKRIETRVLVKTDTGTYGVSYRWNEAQTEAALVADEGVAFDIAIDDHGTAHTQRWQIPARASCLTCHNPQAGHALSFNTRQLNKDFTINGYVGNQLNFLSTGGFLNNTPDPVSTLARHVRPNEDFPLEQRARSYFAVNCSYCHQAGGTAGASWDGRAHLTLEQTGLINGVANNNGGNTANQYVVPGDTAHSIVLSRMAGSNGFGRMPPLATSEIDPTDIQLITDWIASGRKLYDGWRDGYFASNDANGDKTADPDGDGISNYDEYLRGSNPLSGSGAWQASIVNGSLRFLRKANRYYNIQTSDNLGQWQPWTVSELETHYEGADEMVEIPLPTDPDGRQYFRFHVSEP